MRPSKNAGLTAVRYRPPRRGGGSRLGLYKGAALRLGLRVRRGSATRTRQRRKQVAMGVRKIGQNATAGYSRMGRSAMWRLWKSKKRTLGVRVFEHSSGVTLDSYKASQGVYMLPAIMTHSHLKNCSDQASTGTNSSKVIVGGGTTQIHIKNQTNIVAKCFLYEIYTRRTAAGAVVNSPYAAWKQYNADQAIAGFVTETVSLDAAHRVDAKPYNTDVGYYYKIGKVTRLHLEPGMQHNHTIKHRWHKILRREVWEDADSVLQTSIGQWTRHFMLIWYSSLVHDNGVAPTNEAGLLGVKEDLGEVSVCSVRLDVVTRHTYEVMIDNNAVGVITEEAVYPYKVGIMDEDHMGENQDADMDPNRA